MSTDQHEPQTIAVDSTPVGLALAEEDAWSFVATDARFGILNGSRFRRLAAAQSAAERLGRIVLDRPSGSTATSWTKFWGCRLALLAVLLTGVAVVADARAEPGSDVSPLDMRLK